jgi:hypothetical protein
MSATIPNGIELALQIDNDNFLATSLHANHAARLQILHKGDFQKRHPGSPPQYSLNPMTNNPKRSYKKLPVFAMKQEKASIPAF